MKKHLSLALVLLTLPACTQEEASLQRAQADKTINEALTHLNRAGSGVRHTKREQDPRPIEVYKQDELAEAAKKIQPLATSSAPGDQLAARHIASEAAASQGRYLARLASQAATQQAILGSRLSSAASGYRLAQATAMNRAAVEFTKHKADLAKLIEELTAQRQQANSRIQQLQQTIAGLQQEQSTSDAARKEKVKQQDQLSRQSFTAKGQQGFDLYVQAAQAGREADRLNAQADVAAARLDVEQGQLKIEQTLVQQIDEQLAQAKEMQASLENRAKQASGHSDEAAARAAALAKQFDELFNQYVTQQSEQVTKPFDAAIASLQQAVQQMEGALGVAQGSARSFAQLELAGRRTQLGLTLQSAATVAGNYRDTLKSVATSVQAVAPEKMGPLNEIIKDAEGRAAALTDQAKTTLSAAAKDLQELGDDENAKAQLQQVNAALGVLSGRLPAAPSTPAPAPAPAPAAPAAPAPAPAASGPFKGEGFTIAATGVPGLNWQAGPVANNAGVPVRVYIAANPAQPGEMLALSATQAAVPAENRSQMLQMIAGAAAQQFTAIGMKDVQVDPVPAEVGDRVVLNSSMTMPTGEKVHGALGVYFGKQTYGLQVLALNQADAAARVKLIETITE